jgi:hypothetical protein
MLTAAPSNALDFALHRATCEGLEPAFLARLNEIWRALDDSHFDRFITTLRASVSFEDAETLSEMLADYDIQTPSLASQNNIEASPVQIRAAREYSLALKNLNDRMALDNELRTVPA